MRTSHLMNWLGMQGMCLTCLSHEQYISVVSNKCQLTEGLASSGSFN